MTTTELRSRRKGFPLNNRTRRLFPGLALAVFCLVAASFFVTGVLSAETGPPAGQTDFQRMEGRWVRPDGGYILELREIQKDGSLKAAYSNPRPIKVSRAELSRKEGKIALFVELRDVNYPGSTYTLRYDPGTDRLKGTYFQAVQRETYDVEFVRANR